MANKKAIYKVDNGTDYDEIHFKTIAEQVILNNGKNIQEESDKWDCPQNLDENNGFLEYAGNFLLQWHTREVEMTIDSQLSNGEMNLFQKPLTSILQTHVEILSAEPIGMNISQPELKIKRTASSELHTDGRIFSHVLLAWDGKEQDRTVKMKVVIKISLMGIKK